MQNLHNSNPNQTKGHARFPVRDRHALVMVVLDVSVSPISRTTGQLLICILSVALFTTTQKSFKLLFVGLPVPMLALGYPVFG